MRLQHTDALGQPVYYAVHSTAASIGTHTDALYSGGSLGLNLNGSNPALRGKMALWDGGEVRATHRELSGKIFLNEPVKYAVNDHATHMAGTLVARGTYEEARGMAFGAQLKVWDFTNDLSEVISQAPDLLLSNHAYGPVAGWVLNPARPGTTNDSKWEWWGTPSVKSDEDYRFGFYDQTVSDADRILYNYPYYLMVRSADNKRGETGPPAGTPYYLRDTDETSTLARSRNDGYDVIPGEALAKNVLTVGAAGIRDTTFELAGYSGWGPTDDGRIKPDLLGIGTNVLSTLGTADDAYGYYSGTSMASANVTGTLFLLQELYYQQHQAFMLSSTLKGLVLHTADKPTGKTAPGYEYGWGLLNAEKAAKAILNQGGGYLVDQSLLNQSATFTRQVVASGNEPLVVTICWTDPEGTPTPVNKSTVNNPTPKLINDLDLLVTGDAASTQPWVLDPAQPQKEARRGNNFRDNVEQVYIAAPVKGRTYTIGITHKGTLKNGRQPFSLIVSGVSQPDCELAASLGPATETTLCPGSTVVLAAQAGGDFTYEWFFNGSSIKKGTDRQLEVNKPGSYSVKVLGAGCTTTSRPVTVRASVLFARIDPAGKSVVCNSNGLLLSANKGTGFTYQWLLNKQPIAGAITPQWQAKETGSYQLQISDGTCTTVSPPAEVQLTPVTAALTPATGASICNDSPALLSVKPQENCTYTWYLNGSPLAVTPTTTSYAAASPGVYSVEVRNGECRVKSAEVLVEKVNLMATISAPAVVQLAVGDSLPLQASFASGNLYQWYRDNEAIKGATNPLLVVKDRGIFKVNIRNKGCEVESKPITVSINGILLNLPSVAGSSTRPDSLRALVLYPNPTRQELVVTLRQPPALASNVKATLLNTRGQALQTRALVPNQDYLDTRFDLDRLPPGTYIIQIMIGQQPVTKAFIKQ
jgi:hypothetical protein